MADQEVHTVTVLGADGALDLVDRLTDMGYKEIDEGDELRAGYFESFSGEDESGNASSGVNFIELPEHHGLAAKLGQFS